MENVRVQTYAKAARAATALAEIGLKPEALSPLSQAINVASTNRDLRALRQFVVPSIQRIEPDAVLQKLGRYNAVRVRSRADLLSEPSRILYGIKDGSSLKNEIIIDLVPTKKPFEIFENARAELAKGHGEALSVLIDSALATASPEAALAEVFNLVQHSLKRRELPTMSKDPAAAIREAALEFAKGGAISAAREAGVIWTALTPERVSLTQRIAELLNSSSPNEQEPEPPDDPAETLYRLGYPAQSSEFIHFSGHGQSKDLLPPWLYLPEDDALVLKLSDVQTAPTPAPEIHQPELIRTVSFDDIVNAIAGDLRKLRETKSRSVFMSSGDATEPAKNPLRSARPSAVALPPPPPRRINVWLEDSLPLLVHHRCDLWVNIGAPRGDAAASGPFREPDWGTRESLPVVLILTAEDAEISPQ
ncbi:MAG TPA: hypothetical protein VEU30_07455, partial [Thermoanaerobaculia bacterium]|nr:hypothetical protein [Thermoanaerobaculia bacterium]